MVEIKPAVVVKELSKMDSLINSRALVTDFNQKCLQLMNHTHYKFTRRESEVLILSCYGFDIEAIASLLHRSSKTILKHRENARRKTQLKTLMMVATHIWPLINH